MQVPVLPVTNHQGNTQNWEHLRRVLPEPVTALPISPVNGQEVYYIADSANGVIWHLRYRSASTSTHKWEFVGGSPLFAVKTELTTFVLANKEFVWQEIPASPSLTLPLAGDYELAESLEYVQQKSVGENQQLAVGIGANTTTVYFNGLVDLHKQFTAVPLHAQYRITGFAAGAVLKMFVNGNNLNEWGVGNRRMYATPVRVG